METRKSKWLEDYQRIKRNPIFFVEEYYNKLYPDSKICLTDEEKQVIYDKYRINMVPLLDNDSDFRAYDEYHKRIEELRKQGHKDWEIF